MRVLGAWLKTRKGVFSALAVAILAAVPLTIAALHPGFPVSDVQLTSRDVWVTNGEQLLGGRLNRQIDELNGAVVASSPDFTVLQDGDTLFLYDPTLGRLEAVDPASTRVSSSIEVPVGSTVSYGGNLLAIVSPDGDLWTISAVGDLQFDYTSIEPLVALGKNGQAVVTAEGTVLAVSPGEKTLYRLAQDDGAPEEKPFPKVGEFQLSAVGENAVVLDTSTNEFLSEDGASIELPALGIRLQQRGAASDTALVATGDSLLKIRLTDRSIEEIPADIPTPLESPKDVSAPVFLDGCAHAAWGGAQRYLLACDDTEPFPQDIVQPTQGDVLEFRVNRSVIALNNLSNGNVWLVDDNMRLVENWEEVTPPEEQESEEGDEKSSEQSFEDTLAERTDQNRPPIARDDDIGMRPGRTTILPLLDNDTDPDGDVLTIASTSAISETSGVLQYIDGGRALQFTPADGYVGNIAFSYTVDDGRGGRADAQVLLRVVPDDINNPPASHRDAGVTVEANQTVSYNVLTDWSDPDGDDLFLVSAAPKSGDLVRFTPDGYVTFTHQTSELGLKEIVFVVSDGRGEPVQGTLTVDVQPVGTAKPVGTPDFATTLVGESVVVEPLLNDLSPSGAQLSLLAIEEPGTNALASMNGEQGTMTFRATKAGAYYVKYTVAAGATTSVGIIRVDVLENPTEVLPPIAVKDAVYLRGDSPSTVAVLSNDVSPSGKILAVQSIEVPNELTVKGLVVEVLNSTLIRVTSPAALTEQVQFKYTVSDGVGSSSATVTVVPVAPLTKHQPPVALDDRVRVRVGDIATVHVLDNDFHPDDVAMSVSADLLKEPEAGIAFANANTVRFQAPLEPGEYHVDYRVEDPFGQTAAAQVTFTVVGLDNENNLEPVPVPLTARTMAGNNIRVDVPLDGIDPDGDSVQLLGFPSGPGLGTIKEQGATYFIYEAFDTSAGTDSFTYQVYDAFGATGIGEVKIGVIPQPTVALNPSAVPDSVKIRPGRVASVNVIANDSDPQSAPIKVSKELIDVPEGITAKVVDGKTVEIEVPDEVMSFSFRYELTNDRGGRTVSYVQVEVTPDAPLFPPTAEDVVLEKKDVAAKETVTVNLFDNVTNPGGRKADLVLTLEGPNASAAALTSKDGVVRVTPGKTRQAIAFRVTNDIDELSAMAFIIVPAAVGDEFKEPPMIDPSLPTQIIRMNETKEWKLQDIVYVPSGNKVMITSESTVIPQQSNGDKIYIDKDTLRFTPIKDYRGPASITFEVTDGGSPDDPNGNKATLRLNIIVGDPEFRDTPPEFTPPSITVEVGEQTTFDLRTVTAHPNPSILQDVTYSNLTGGGTGLTQSLSGSELTVSTPRNTKKGTTFTLGVTLRWAEFEVPGTIQVTVVSSTRPLPVAVEDALEGQRGGPAKIVNALANDSNPYQTTGEPLTIIAAVEQTATSAQVTFTGTTVTVKPGPNFVNGDVVVVYTIEDATQDPDRNVQGFIRVTIRDVPDSPSRPTANAGDAVATVDFTDNANNGEAIDAHELTYQGEHWNGSGSGTDNGTISCGPPRCTVPGLKNGYAYTFSARSHNELGWSAWSSASAAVTPYGTPAQVTGVAGGAPSGYANASITWNWNAVGGTGGATTYFWRINSGQSGSTTGTSATVGSLPAGTYQMFVYAQNGGGIKGTESAGSNVVTVVNKPVPTTWQLTANVNTCPEPNPLQGRFSGSGATAACQSPGWLRQGSVVTVDCYRNLQSGTPWYRIVGGGSPYSNDGTWYVKSGTVDGSTGAVPAC